MCSDECIRVDENYLVGRLVREKFFRMIPLLQDETHKELHTQIKNSYFERIACFDKRNNRIHNDQDYHGDDNDVFCIIGDLFGFIQYGCCEPEFFRIDEIDLRTVLRTVKSNQEIHVVEGLNDSGGTIITQNSRHFLTLMDHDDLSILLEREVTDGIGDYHVCREQVRYMHGDYEVEGLNNTQFWSFWDHKKEFTAKNRAFRLLHDRAFRRAFERMFTT